MDITLGKVAYARIEDAFLHWHFGQNNDGNIQLHAYGACKGSGKSTARRGRIGFSGKHLYVDRIGVDVVQRATVVGSGGELFIRLKVGSEAGDAIVLLKEVGDIDQLCFGFWVSPDNVEGSDHGVCLRVLHGSEDIAGRVGFLLVEVSYRSFARNRWSAR